MTRTLVFACAIAALLAAAGCGRERPRDAAPTVTQSDEEATAPFGEEALSGRVEVDGSSTVAPLVTLAAERFRAEQPGVDVTVGVSGTGGGFERFCAGETDIATASRAIEDEEKTACARKGIDFRELHVANDGLSIVVNPANDWASCLTVAQLERLWRPGSKIDNWRELDPRFPDRRVRLFGPGTDSGTFDYFTDAIVGEEGASRSDYQASENDNVIVNGVANEEGGLGYLGLAYVEQSGDKLEAVAVDGGAGCVEPSVQTVQDGSYKPLSRPLYVYVRRDALARSQVDAFVTFVLDNVRELARDALFVPLTSEQLARTRNVLEGSA